MENKIYYIQTLGPTLIGIIVLSVLIFLQYRQLKKWTKK